MIDLSTEYLGLKLKNPLVPSASPLSRSLGKARALEDAGASAIVMYSLFEEELRVEEAMAERFLLNPELGHAEAAGFLPDQKYFWNRLDSYLDQIRRLKESLDIPVIASLNGISLDGWVELGTELQQAGADALELNVYHIPGDIGQSAETIEQHYIDLVKELRGSVSLPIAVKLSPFFSSLPHFVQRLEGAGANGVALFNRFYQPDIDLDSLKMGDQLHLSSPTEALLRLRWIGILYGRTRLGLAATGGVHGPD